MEHPAFVDAGGAPGIEIWTIDNFEPVPVENKLYGSFFNGDSYVVLKTTGEPNSTLHHDAHFWLGKKTTQDKMGSAAIWTVTLDDMLGGRAVHHREVQGHESSLFLGYFKPAIKYLEGGNESGFNSVETNAGAEKRLLKLSGCENMRIETVPAESSSLTQEHCFILEVDHDIFVLMPQGAKATQRRKIIDVANKLRDDNHNGRASIEIIDEFSSDEDVAAFFEALGSGCREDIGSDDSSSSYTRAAVNDVYLYRVVTGEDLDLIALNKPYKQTQLSSDEIYILDTPCSGVYIWIGSGVDPDVKKTCYDLANQYLEIKEYPNWVNITKVTEGAESRDFKQYFHNWETVSSTAPAFLTDSDAGYFSEDVEQSAAIAKLIGKSAAARAYMPDDGAGDITVIRIAGEQEDITEQFLSGVCLFYQGQVYIVKYKFTGENGEDSHVVYCWVGQDASSSDKALAEELLQEIEDELEGATIVRVPQWKEPKHLLKICKGLFAILLGGKDNDYKPTNSRGSYDDDNVRLFRVEGTEVGVDMRAIQLPETAHNLEDDDVYVLETTDTVYVWHGKDSNATEQEAVFDFVKIIVGDNKEAVPLQQGDEPEQFWEALGGPVDEKEDPSGWKLAVNRRVTATHTLSAVNVSVTKKITFEDLDAKYTQQDLSDDGVYILDTGEELYLWQGRNIPERVKLARSDIVMKYIEDDGLDRTVDTALVVLVKQGYEPAVFKKHFGDWDSDMWDNLQSYEDMKNETMAANSK